MQVWTTLVFSEILQLAWGLLLSACILMVPIFLFLTEIFEL